MDSVEFSAAFCYYMHRYRRIGRRTNPPNAFSVPHPDLFRAKFKMPQGDALELWRRLEHRLGTSSADMLAFTLLYLAGEDDFPPLCERHDMDTVLGKAVVRQTCSAIVEALRDEYMPAVTKDSLVEGAKLFGQLADFPQCVGAVGCKLYALTGDPKAPRYLQSLTLIDARYKILKYRFASLSETPFDNQLYFRNVFPLCAQYFFSDLEIASLKSEDLPYVVAGDEAFASNGTVLAPFAGTGGRQKLVYNLRLGAAHRCSDGAFAAMSQRWKVMREPLPWEDGLAEVVVEACFALHNYIVQRNGLDFEDTLHKIGPENGIARCSSDQTDDDKTREEFVKYFYGDKGKVSWQYVIADSISKSRALVKVEHG